MGLNTRFEKAVALTTVGLTITWTANEPTASTTQTIADGNSMTDAETGQFAANIVAELDKIKADLTELRRITNAGE